MKGTVEGGPAGQRPGRDLLIFAFANLALVALLLVTVGDDAERRFLTFQSNIDSWSLMGSAYDYHHEHPDRPLYADLFFERHQKFQYPPSSLLVMSVLRSGVATRLFRAMGVSEHDALTCISWLAALATMLLTLRIFRVAVGEARLSRTDRALAACALFLLALTFYPIIQGFSLGQIQVWLDALFAAALLCWVSGKTVAAGILIGLSCLVKPQFALFLPWGLLRRQWSFVIAFGAAVLAGLAVSLAFVGVSDHFAYLDVLSYISRHGEAFHANQSFNGLLNRLLVNGSNLRWTPKAYAPYNAWVHAGTLATSILLVVLALAYFPGKTSKAGNSADFALMALACTMASPIAWEHHYGILLPIYALILAALLRNPRPRSAPSSDSARASCWPATTSG